MLEGEAKDGAGSVPPSQSTARSPSRDRRGTGAPGKAGRGRSARADEQVARLHASFALSRDPRLRTELVTYYDNLAVSLARRFPSRRDSREDLVQVARIGLIHAVDRFDPNRNRPFVAFARPTIIGELKRHVRDHTWGMRVPRTLQERYLHVAHSADDLIQELGRAPRIPEVAARVGLNDQQAREAIDVDLADRILSLDRPNDDGRHLDPWEESRDLERVEARIDLAALVRDLPERTQRVLELRFVEELTQSEIARHVGASQMCVSRTLTKALAQMRVTPAAAGPRMRREMHPASSTTRTWE